MKMLEIICGDAVEELQKLKAKSVQCCVTSPPYWGLRNKHQQKIAFVTGVSACGHYVAVSYFSPTSKCVHFYKSTDLKPIEPPKP